MERNIQSILPVDIWENEISKFLTIKDIVNLSACSRKLNSLSTEMLNNCRDETMILSYENYIKNKSKIDYIRNIKKILNVEIKDRIGCVKDVKEDINGFELILYSDTDFIEFDKEYCINYLNITSIVTTKDISIIRSLNFSKLETLYLCNINLSEFSKDVFKNIKSLEIESCTGLYKFETDEMFPKLERLCLKSTRVDSVNNITSLKHLEMERINNTTLLYNIPNLNYLKCHNCSISNLENVNSIESLDLSMCSNISSLDLLFNIKTININGCRRIKSIKNLKKLENIKICNWNGQI